MELYEQLRVAAAGQAHRDPDHPAYAASAISATVDLETPTSGEKVHPPTYAGSQGSAYQLERRHKETPSDGHDTVVLDSVASQANRMELALLEAHRAGTVAVPVLSLDMGERWGTITALELPARCYDGWIIDSFYDGVRFPDSVPGREIGVGEWRPPGRERDVSGHLAWCPTSISHGGWDSFAGRKTLRAASFARVLQSEIVGHDPCPTVRGAGRIDPYNISAKVPLYVDEHGRPTFQGGGKGSKALRPSTFGYGNIAPGFENGKGESNLGGVGISGASQYASLSLAGTRRLRFPLRDGSYDPAVEVAGRVAVLALSLLEFSLQLFAGYDLRSGCTLIPKADPVVTLIGRTAERRESISLTPVLARQVLDRAIGDARSAGLDWHGETIALTPSPVQVEIAERSAMLKEAESGEETV